MMQKNFSERSFAQKIGMSSTGFRAAMERQTLSVQILENIADVLGVSVISFFEGSETREVHEPPEHYSKKCTNCAKKDGQIELFTKLLAEKEQQIANLNKELGRKLGRENNHVA